METTIFRTIKGSQMVIMFESSSNIRFFTTKTANNSNIEEKHKYEICIRHFENINPNILFDEMYYKLFPKNLNPIKTKTMKNLTKTTAILIIALILNFSVKAQNATKTTDGNYTAVKYNFNDTTRLKNTGKTYSDAKGNTLPVYESSTGKLFVIRTSKAGNDYRMYLKL